MKLGDLSAEGVETAEGGPGSMSMARLVRLAAGFSRTGARPHVILLQGPAGPFFRTLQAELDRNGIDATQICFNAADLFFAGSNKLRYCGDLQDWGAWLTEILLLRAPECIVLYGAERPAHRTARLIAERMGIRVVCLEEGYIRPGYISAEDGGNNATSPLAGRLPPHGRPRSEAHPPFQVTGFRHMITCAALYYTLRAILSWDRPSNLDHRPFFAAGELCLWLRNGVRFLTGTARNRKALAAVSRCTENPYFLVPLQVSSDSNLKQAAFGWTNARLIEDALIAFAHSAAKEARLVFKIHPMERGHSSCAPLIRRLARRHKVEPRTLVIDQGAIGPLTRGAAGMVTINSTSGLSALHHGVPLLVIGEAIYANPALATCGFGSPDLGKFFNTPPVPDTALAQRFLEWLRTEALLPGDYYSRPGRMVAARALTRKLRQAELTAPQTKAALP